VAQDGPLQIRAIREHAHVVSEARPDYDPLFEMIGDSRFVLLGEASHGTHDFYLTRAQITEWLIQEKGFAAVAVEADWPDAHRVNRYVQGRGDDTEAVEALDSFKRFPTWMWRNTDIVEFVDWLREYNDALEEGKRKVGFHGLDLYSLHSSARAVLDFLDKVDPEAARRARYRYSCFEHFGEDTQAYGYAVSFGLSKSCEDEAVNQLIEMQKRAAELASRDGKLAIIGRCSKAESSPGTFATSIWSRLLKHWNAISVRPPRLWFGHTTLISGMLAPQKWAREANLTSAN
jgi:erythromycin esterase-like protein